MHWSEVPKKASVTPSIENSKGFMNAVQSEDTDKLNPTINTVTDMVDSCEEVKSYEV